jgi:UDP-N-acetylmuramoyl-tripeptide--D-alanyl-D-alanine ligase
MTGTLYVALRGERFDGHDFISQAQQQGAVALLVDRAVTSDLPYLEVADTRKALGDLAHFWRQRFSLPLIAITGSNGKTTVKELIRCILSETTIDSKLLVTRGNLNNDIGVPLTLFRLNTDHQWAVIEMGANHVGEIAYLSKMASPTVAVITQCAPAHLEGFKTVERVAQAKGEIFKGLKPHSTAIINNDDIYAPLWREMVLTYAPPTTNVSYFALRSSAEVTTSEIQLTPTGSEFMLHTPLGETRVHLPLLGQHNIMNALAASACALASGCSLETIQRGLQNVQPVKGRLQRCVGLNGALLIDDTYNANPTSLNAALTVLNKYSTTRWLVLGNMYELGTQSELLHKQAGQSALHSGVERLWTLGDIAYHATESFGVGALHFSEHETLIATLKTELATQQGVTILIKGSRSMQMEKIVKALCS